MNLIINLTNDETEILPSDSEATLASYGIGALQAWPVLPFFFDVQ